MGAGGTESNELFNHSFRSHEKQMRHLDSRATPSKLPEPSPLASQTLPRKAPPRATPRTPPFPNSPAPRTSLRAESSCSAEEVAGEETERAWGRG